MMVRLLFDVGNTRVKWAWHDGAQWLEQNACALEAFVPEQVLSQYAIHEVWIASMDTTGVYRDLIKGFEQLFTHRPPRRETVQVTANAGGISNAYQALDRLGIDRWLSVIGARARIAQGNVLVIDAGTAINIECLDANDVYQGGAILPGFRLMHDALVGRVPAIDSQVTDTLPGLGKNTAECVNFGVGYGVAGAVERVVDEMQLFLADIHPTTTAILSGGNARNLSTRLNLPIDSQIIDNLVLEGLLQLALRDAQ